MLNHLKREGCEIKLYSVPLPHFTVIKQDPNFHYLTIIRRRQGEYCRIIPETKSRGLFDNIHRA